MRTFLTRVLAGARRNAMAGVVVVALVVATAIAVPLAMSVSLQHPGSVPSASQPKVKPKPNPLGMGSYPTSSYEAAAKKLPAALATALRRDVHLTTAQYLANSAAAVQGVKVVATLKSSGVSVLGSSMSGTKLIVNVASQADVAAVQALGATAVLGAPKVRTIARSSSRPPRRRTRTAVTRISFRKPTRSGPVRVFVARSVSTDTTY